MTAVWLGRLLFLLAAIGCAYLGLAIVAVLRFPRRGPPPAGPAPAVTILKPLHGAEPGLRQRLASFCRQDYAGAVEILCGVRDAGDPALAEVAALAAEFPAVAVRAIVDPRVAGANRKIANLVNMAPAASHDTLIVSDSDIAVCPDYLAWVTAALAGPGIGAVTCLYRGEPGAGLWARLGAMGIDGHFLPGVLVALLTHLAKPAFGSTIALRREAYDAIGGFAPFLDRLADDNAMGAAVRAAGWRVAIPPLVVTHACTEASLAALWRHELRWARTNRTVAPLGFAGTLVTHPLPLAVLGWLFGSMAALSLVLPALLLRVGLALVLQRRLGVPAPALWLIPLRDGLSFAVYVGSFFGAGVEWRGEHLTIGRGGGVAGRGERPVP